MASAGDVNGDDGGTHHRYAAIIVGAPYQTEGATQSGQVTVYLGSNQGITTTDVWTATVAKANAFFGGSVGTAGDVNGDGYNDIIIGAMTYADGQAGEGAAFV